MFSDVCNATVIATHDTDAGVDAENSDDHSCIAYKWYRVVVLTVCWSPESFIGRTKNKALLFLATKPP